MKKRTMAILTALMLVAVIFVATVAVALASVRSDGYCPADGNIPVGLSASSVVAGTTVTISVPNVGFPPIVIWDGIQIPDVMWSSGGASITATIPVTGAPGLHTIGVSTQDENYCDYSGSADINVEAATVANTGSGSKTGGAIQAGTVSASAPGIPTKMPNTGMEMLIPLSGIGIAYAGRRLQKWGGK